MPSYTPRKGDFVALTFDPQSGHEQKGRRPALVVSNDLFNERTGLALVCPITKTDRRIPFHIPVPRESVLTGFVMVRNRDSHLFSEELRSAFGQSRPLGEPS